MTPLAMFTEPLHPDAWRNVKAPGGYEWWYFDAESTDGRTQVVAIFFDGFVFHPEYLRRYWRYRRRPSRLAPPVAADYPCVYLAWYRDGAVVGQVMSQLNTSDCEFSSRTPAVSLAASSFTRDSDGTLRVKVFGQPWRLTWRGPQRITGEQLSAELAFRPLGSAPDSAAAVTQRRFFSRKLSGADHGWILANPSCRVTGTLTFDSGAASAAPQGFEGLGYHDHNFGTGPIGPGIRRWLWGRAFDTGDLSERGQSQGSFVFHCTGEGSNAMPAETHLLHSDGGTTKSLDSTISEIDWRRHTSVGLGFPSRLTFRAGLALSEPKIVESTPFYLRLTYQARYQGRQIRDAFCEVAYPHRLRWPILGRMIEMSIARPR